MTEKATKGELDNVVLDAFEPDFVKFNAAWRGVMTFLDGRRGAMEDYQEALITQRDKHKEGDPNRESCEQQIKESAMKKIRRIFEEVVEKRENGVKVETISLALEGFTKDKGHYVNDVLTNLVEPESRKTFRQQSVSWTTRNGNVSYFDEHNLDFIFVESWLLTFTAKTEELRGALRRYDFGDAEKHGKEILVFALDAMQYEINWAKTRPEFQAGCKLGCKRIPGGAERNQPDARGNCKCPVASVLGSYCPGFGQRHYSATTMESLTNENLALCACVPGVPS
jgi:hypothetical protein